ITVRNTIVTLVWREVNIAHFLHLGPFIILQLISCTGQWFEVLTLNGLEEFDTAGLFTPEQKTVVSLQQYADLSVEIFQGEEDHLPQGIINALIGQVYGILHQRLVLR